MINVHLYGELRKLVPGSSWSQDTIIEKEYIEGETFDQFIQRLDLKHSQLGDCFIDGTLAKKDMIIKDNARVALFPFNMVLLCGGQHLKGHGYTRKDVDVNYY